MSVIDYYQRDVSVKTTLDEGSLTYERSKPAAASGPFNIAQVLPRRASAAWTIIAKAKHKSAALAIVSRIEKAIGASLQLTEVEPYWKGKDEFRIIGSSDHDVATVEGAIVQYLDRLGRLAARWNVSPPVRFDAETKLDAVADKGLSVPGVTFISSELSISAALD